MAIGYIVVDTPMFHVTGESARHLVVLCRLSATLAQPSDAAVNQLLRVRISDDGGTGWSHRQRIKERLRQVRHPARPLQEADDFALVVGNRQFIEGADAAGDEETISALRTAMTLRPLNPKPE